ncbi:MAG: MFS transporter [Chlamydiales bacterium]|nr:MFS transporter [Chlamydiales bacterium]
MDKFPRRHFSVIIAIVFLGFIGISMPYLIFPPLFLNSSYAFLPKTCTEASRALFLGITLAAYPLGQFMGSAILGSLSDEYGRKKILITSLLIASISNLFSAISIANQQVVLLIASRLIAGLMEGNITIARAMASDIKSISKHKSFGKINASASIAFLLGPLLGGVLSERAGFSTPFFLIGILFFILSGLSGLFLKESRVKEPFYDRYFVAVKPLKLAIRQRMNIVRRISNLFSSKELKFFLIVSTSFTLAVDIFYEFGPVYLTMKWALSPAKLIFYNGLLCLGLTIGNGWLPTYLTRYISNHSAIITGLGGFALFIFCLPLINWLCPENCAKTLGV